MVILTVGSTGANEGVITATADTDATVTAQINVGNNQTLMAIYTVPAGKTAYLTCMFESVIKQVVAAGGMVEMMLYVREDASQADSCFLVKHSDGLSITGTSKFQHCYDPFFRIPEKSDIKVRVSAILGNDADVTAGFDLILVDN